METRNEWRLEMYGDSECMEDSKLWTTRMFFFGNANVVFRSALRAYHYWIAHFADAAPFMFFLRVPILNEFLKAQATMNMNKQVNALNILRS